MNPKEEQSREVGFKSSSPSSPACPCPQAELPGPRAVLSDRLYLHHPFKQPVVNDNCSVNGAIGKEEGSQHREDRIGPSNAAVHS